jgi:hypothetical protein
VTNIARNISSWPGPALVNLFFMLKLLHLPLILSGLLKLGYDITIYKLDITWVKTMVRRLPIFSAISGAMINEIAVMTLDMLKTTPKNSSVTLYLT